MLLKDKIYLHELREQFLLKVVDEWPSKWQKEFEEFSSFEALKSKNAFLEALLVDIEAVLHQQLNGEAKNELFSKDFLRRFIFEYGTKDVRIQTRFRNAVSVYLGYTDWDDFQQKNNDLDRQNIHITYVNIEESFLPALRKMQVIPISDEPYTSFQTVKPRFTLPKFVPIFLGVLAAAVLSYFGFKWWQSRPFSSEELKEVQFKVIKTVGKYPQSVRIMYDVRPLKRVRNVELILGVGKIVAANNFVSYITNSVKTCDTVSQTYFYPGVYRLNLLVNKHLIKTDYHTVYSYPNQWAAWGFGVAYEKNWTTNISTVKTNINEGVLHLDPRDLPNEIKGEDDYRHTVYALTQDFGIRPDSVTLEARLKNPESEGGESCFNTDILLTDKNLNIAEAEFTMMGCSDYAKLIVGKTIFRKGNLQLGKNVDLDNFSVNHNEWNTFKLQLKDNLIEVFVNGNSVFRGEYERPENFTNLTDIRFTFKGTGSVDWVKVSNSYTGKVVYQTDF
ncbi:MAG: hypothetical protein U0X91_22465 [Spirosomataceae bacterium]